VGSVTRKVARLLSMESSSLLLELVGGPESGPESAGLGGPEITGLGEVAHTHKNPYPKFTFFTNTVAVNRAHLRRSTEQQG
jgi:hypothetical protein